MKLSLFNSICTDGEESILMNIRSGAVLGLNRAYTE